MNFQRVIPGSGRSPGEGNGNRLHSSCLENPKDRGAWQNTVHGVASSFQFSSVTQSCPTLCDPMNHSTPGLPVTNSWSSPKLKCVESVMPSSHLILCHPLLFLPPIPPSIRVFSNESVLPMRWPQYWSFSLSISPSNEHPGLVSPHVETVETVSDSIFGGSKITADGDCSHGIKRHLLLERKVMTNLDSIFKSRDIALQFSRSI